MTLLESFRTLCWGPMFRGIKNTEQTTAFQSLTSEKNLLVSRLIGTLVQKVQVIAKLIAKLSMYLHTYTIFLSKYLLKYLCIYILTYVPIYLPMYVGILIHIRWIMLFQFWIFWSRRAITKKSRNMCPGNRVYPADSRALLFSGAASQQQQQYLTQN